MNANAQNYELVIQHRMNIWLEVAECGIVPQERTKARRNLRRLIRKYPELASGECFEFLGIPIPKETETVS